MPEASVARKRPQKIARKLCIKCGQVLALNEFYHNRDWAEQSFRDAWCKNCVNDFCTTRNSLREYCWHNNRSWSDDYYNQAMNRALYSLSTSDEYLAASAKGAEDKVRKLEEKAACRCFLGIMNLAGIYHYTDNVSAGGNYRSFRLNSPDETPTSKREKPSHEDGELIWLEASLQL